MVKVKGTGEEIAALLRDLSAKYPADLIMALDLGEWVFIRDGIEIQLIIEEE